MEKFHKQSCDLGSTYNMARKPSLGTGCQHLERPGLLCGSRNMLFGLTWVGSSMYVLKALFYLLRQGESGHRQWLVQVSLAQRKPSRRMPKSCGPTDPEPYSELRAKCSHSPRGKIRVRMCAGWNSGVRGKELGLWVESFWFCNNTPSSSLSNKSVVFCQLPL